MSREPDCIVGASKGHGSVRLTGRRGERRLARVAPQEGEDWGTTVRAALSAGPDNDRDVARRSRITHRPQSATPSSDWSIGGRDRDALTAEVAGRSPSAAHRRTARRHGPADDPPALIARAYRPFAQACCGRGAGDGSLAAQELTRATPDTRWSGLHLIVVGPTKRKALTCPLPNLS
jgi:hypothetical protein